MRMPTVCLILLALAVTGAASPVAADERAAIRLWTSQFEPENLAQIRYLTTAFTALTGGAEVEVTGFDEDEFFVRWDQARREDRLPHLIEAPRKLLAELDRRRLVDPERVAATIGRIGSGRFLPGPLDSVRRLRGGGHFAIPMHAWAQGVWYRQDWFEAAKLAAPESPEALLRAARHFHDPAAGRYGIVLGTGDSVYTEQGFLHIAAAFGANLLSPPKTLEDMQDRLADSLAFYETLARYAPAEGVVTWRDYRRFLDGKAAMLVYSTFFIDRLVREDRVRAEAPLSPQQARARAAEVPGSAPLAAQVGRVTCLRGPEVGSCHHYGELTALSILRVNGGVPWEAPVDLASFLYRPDAYAAWLHMRPGGMLPTLKLEHLPRDMFIDLNRIYARYGRSRFNRLLSGPTFQGAFAEDAWLAAQLRADGLVSHVVSAVVAGRISPEAGARQLVDELGVLRQRLAAGAER